MLYALKNKATGQFEVWQDRVGHAQPQVYLTQSDADKALDAMLHAKAKHLSVVTLLEIADGSNLPVALVETSETDSVMGDRRRTGLNYTAR
jgi:hypothetical protein